MPAWKRRVITAYVGRSRRAFGIKLVPHEHTLSFTGVKPGERRPRQRCLTCPWVEPRKPIRVLTNLHIDSFTITPGGMFSVHAIEKAPDARVVGFDGTRVGEVVEVTTDPDGVRVGIRLDKPYPEVLDDAVKHYSAVLDQSSMMAPDGAKEYVTAEPLKILPNPIPELPRHERLNLRRKVPADFISKAKSVFRNNPVPAQREPEEPVHHTPTVDELVKLKRDTLAEYMTVRGLKFNSKTNKQQMAEALVQHWNDEEEK